VGAGTPLGGKTSVNPMVIDSQAALKAGFREMHLSACNQAFASGIGEAAGPLPMLL